MGSNDNKKKIENDLEVSPLTLCGEPMKTVPAEKYLGDMISCNGLAASVEATVAKRRGQVFSNILEIKAVIEDYRATVVGGVAAGIEIWELAIMPFLMNNSETWVEISPKTIENLDNLQNMFYTLQVPVSHPKVLPHPCSSMGDRWPTYGTQDSQEEATFLPSSCKSTRRHPGIRSGYPAI